MFPGVTKKDYETLAAFRYELRKFLRFSERAAGAHGLASQQYLALLAIEGFPGPDPIAMGALAERLCIAPHSAVGLVDRLEKAGLVKRSNALSDRRKVVIQLTRKGKIKLAKLAKAHHTELQTVGPLLTGLLQQVAPCP